MKHTWTCSTCGRRWDYRLYETCPACTTPPDETLVERLGRAMSVGARESARQLDQRSPLADLLGRLRDEHDG